METLANLESFVRSAHEGSFSAAARALVLTPAAVSRNVALLERNLGVRLFHRSTRKLTLTETGERFLHEIEDQLDALRATIEGVAADQGEPAGVLRISMSTDFGLDYILPHLPAFLARYPRIQADWRFENRQADLIAEGIDVAIGGGFALAPGVVARPLAPAHLIAVASPRYLEGRTLPADPLGLATLNGIVMRSPVTGRIRSWVMRNMAGDEMTATLKDVVIFNDPGALCRAALLGLGVTFVTVSSAIAYLERGELIRLVPQWYGDAGSFSLYYASRAQVPAKTRAFVDFITAAFRRDGLAEKLAGTAR